MVQVISSFDICPRLEAETNHVRSLGHHHLRLLSSLLHNVLLLVLMLIHTVLSARRWLNLTFRTKLREIPTVLKD